MGGVTMVAAGTVRASIAAFVALAALVPGAAGAQGSDRDNLPSVSTASREDDDEQRRDSGVWDLIGGFEHYNEILAGEVRYDAERSELRFELEGTQTRLRCVGPGEIKSTTGSSQCPAFVGEFRLLCGVQRELFGTFEHDKCGYGFAAGIDTLTGSTVALHFGLPPDRREIRLQTLEARAAEQPPLLEAGEYLELADLDPEIYGFGTGFAITEDGIILTAAHVVEDEYGIEIYAGSRRARAELLAIDRENDLALLKTDLTFEPLPVMLEEPAGGGSLAVKAIGYRFTPHNALRQDAVTSYAEAVGWRNYYVFEGDVIPGYSGGPVFNLPEHKVIGVIHAISVEHRLSGWDEYTIEKNTIAIDHEAMLAFLERSLDPETMAKVTAIGNAAPTAPALDASDSIVIVTIY